LVVPPLLLLLLLSYRMNPPTLCKYHLSNNSSTASDESPTEGLESIAKILSISDYEELGVSLQFYRDKAHVDQARSKMMQDETFGAIGKEFDSLGSPGNSMIRDGFIPPFRISLAYRDTDISLIILNKRSDY
jgi:uncharacterized protein YbaA (DUF1428 family)